MGISKYFRAFTYTAAATVAGGALAVEPPVLPDAADYLVQHGMDKDSARSFVRAAAETDQVKMLTSDNMGQVMLLSEWRRLKRGPLL